MQKPNSVKINGMTLYEGDMASYKDNGYLGSGIAIIQEIFPDGTAHINVIKDDYSRNDFLPSSTTKTTYELSHLALDDPRRRKIVQHLSMLAVF